MRVASIGKYNVIGKNRETGKVIYPFYDGFKTKKEAINMADAMDKADDKHSYSVIDNK